MAKKVLWEGKIQFIIEETEDEFYYRIEDDFDADKLKEVLKEIEDLSLYTKTTVFETIVGILERLKLTLIGAGGDLVEETKKKESS